jgi:hypothetical protein
MRRFAAGLSSFLFAVIFAAPSIPGSSACPVSPPVPLRGLYIKSELVVVGKIGTPGKWKIQPREEQENESENYRYYNRIVPVQIEETIKGTAPQTLLIRENESRWINPAEVPKTPAPGAVQTPEDVPEFSSTLTENTERRLFFLSPNADGDGSYFEIYSGRRFQPEQKNLPVFISRLRELHGIYSAPVPSKQMIIEWVVAMAEDPVTRFEGAYELRQALYSTGREEEREEGPEVEPEKDEQADTAEIADADNADAAQETNENSAEVTADNVISQETLESLPRQIAYNRYQDYSDIAELLTPAQKERLIQAFLNIQFTYKVAEKPARDEDEDEDAGDNENEGPPEIEYEDALNEADELLLNAVGELNDRRVVNRIIAELPAVNKYGPRYAFSMIEILSGYFNDEKLEKLSDKYSDVYWGGENALIEEEETAGDLPDAPIDKNDKTPDDPLPDAAFNEAKALRKARAENYVPSKTYGQRRHELLAQILIRCAELGGKKAKGK